jgi:hypothetical protein
MIMSQSTYAAGVLIIAALCAATNPGSVAAQAGHQLTTYRGTCDGSAGVALDQDRFVVADDDNNVLQVYRTGQPDAVLDLNLDQFLEAPTKKKPGPDGKPAFKEADLEGAARIGDRIYWIGSHGRDSKGEDEPGRSRFFATRIVAHPDGPRLEPIGARAYKTLREDMFDDPKLKPLKLSEAFKPGKEDGPSPESETGFNIEGLAATPDGRLLIAFRNPRPGKEAIVIPLDNPADVVDAGKKPVFGKPTRLILEGRGIRSIEWINNTYVIVAGPHGKAKDSDVKPPFALFTWSGKEDDTKPRMVQNVALPGDFSPEAVFAVPGSPNMMLLSDDGSDDCKEAAQPQKSFRALTLPRP